MERLQDSTVKVIMPLSIPLLASALQTLILAGKPVKFIQEEPSAEGSQATTPQLIVKVLSSGGPEELLHLIEQFPHTPILVFSQEDALYSTINWTLKELSLKGALGSEVGLGELPEVVLGVPRGEIATDFPGEDRGLPGPTVAENSLTTREREVTALLAQGATNKEICSRLCISKNTAKTHIRHIGSKLKTTNRAQVALLAGKYYNLTQPKPGGKYSVHQIRKMVRAVQGKLI